MRDCLCALSMAASTVRRGQIGKSMCVWCCDETIPEWNRRVCAACGGVKQNTRPTHSRIHVRISRVCLTPTQERGERERYFFQYVTFG